LRESLIVEARIELASKSCEQIEHETAARWAARAVAAYEAYVQMGSTYWLASSVSYANEAIEHAASAGPGAADAARAELTAVMGDGLLGEGPR